MGPGTSDNFEFSFFNIRIIVQIVFENVPISNSKVAKNIFSTFQNWLLYEWYF